MASASRWMERLSLHVIVQAVADLADNQPRSRKDHERYRLAAQRDAWSFLIGSGPDNKFGIEYWCDAIGLDPDYIANVARKIKDDAELAAQVRHRISYIGSDGSKGSFLTALGLDEELEREETPEGGEVEEAAGREAEEEWRYLVSNSSSKRESEDSIA